VRFEVTVCSESLFDMTCPAILCVELDGRKVLDVVFGSKLASAEMGGTRTHLG
jgi:hypothetical protein